MLRIFMRVILGGTTNKREGPLFAFLIAVALMGYVVVKTAQGVDMSAVVGMVSTFGAASLAAFVGGAALHHMRPPADPQILPENGPSPSPEGEWTGEPMEGRE